MNTTNSKAVSSDAKNEVRTEWFGALIHDLKLTKNLLNNSMASKDTTNMFDGFIFGDGTDLFSTVREKSTQALISKLIHDYFAELQKLEVSPLKLYLDHNDSQLFVWAEIEDDDD